MATRIKSSDITIVNGGYWTGGTYYEYNGIRLCSAKNPTIVLTTQNEWERKLRSILPKIEGAKCLYKENKQWYKYDCYERKIPCGSVSEEIWDLRDVFDCHTPLGELLDYIECCKCGIEDEWVNPKKRNSLIKW
jgi:hypothetical protein